MTNEKLFDDNIMLAYKVANNYKINYINEFEDIKQIALEGLWLAVINYNGSVKFSSYAWIVMNNNIKRYIRSVKNKNNYVVNMQDNINEDFTYEDLIPDNINYEEVVITKINTKILNDAIKTNSINFKPREKQILSLRMKNKTQVDVAAELGVSQAVISRAEKEIKNKVKSILN